MTITYLKTTSATLPASETLIYKISRTLWLIRRPQAAFDGDDTILFGVIPNVWESSIDYQKSVLELDDEYPIRIKISAVDLDINDPDLTEFLNVALINNSKGTSISLEDAFVDYETKKLTRSQLVESGWFDYPGLG